MLNWAVKNLKAIIGTVLAGGLITVCTMAYRSTDFYKATQNLPAMEVKIKFLMNHISEEKKEDKKKANDIAVGIRYNVSLKKFYWRDANKYYREIYTDDIGTFYRNDKDRKVYIKF
jgi:hypothetical protein